MRRELITRLRAAEERRESASRPAVHVLSGPPDEGDAACQHYRETTPLREQAHVVVYLRRFATGTGLLRR